MKKAIEEKVTKLKENQSALVKAINDGTRMLEKARTDLAAVNGALQVCDQLLNEEKGDDNAKN